MLAHIPTFKKFRAIWMPEYSRMLYIVYCISNLVVLRHIKMKNEVQLL